MGTVPRSAHRRLQDEREAVLHLVRVHKGRSVAVVGSVARGDDTADSDIDLLVDFEPGSSLLDLIDLEAALRQTALLDRDIDIRRDAVPL